MKSALVAALIGLSSVTAFAAMEPLTRGHACFGDGVMSVEKSNGVLVEQSGGIKFYNNNTMKFVVSNWDGTSTTYDAPAVQDFEILKYDAETGKTLALLRKQKLVGELEGIKCLTQPLAKMIVSYKELEWEVADPTQIDKLVEVLSDAHYTGIRLVVGTALGEEEGGYVSQGHGMQVAYLRSLKLQRLLKERLGGKMDGSIRVLAGPANYEVDGVQANEIRIDVF